MVDGESLWGDRIQLCLARIWDGSLNDWTTILGHWMIIEWLAPDTAHCMYIHDCLRGIFALMSIGDGKGQSDQAVEDGERAWAYDII